MGPQPSKKMKQVLTLGSVVGCALTAQLELALPEMEFRLPRRSACQHQDYVNFASSTTLGFHYFLTLLTSAFTFVHRCTQGLLSAHPVVMVSFHFDRTWNSAL